MIDKIKNTFGISNQHSLKIIENKSNIELAKLDTILTKIQELNICKIGASMFKAIDNNTRTFDLLCCEVLDVERILNSIIKINKTFYIHTKETKFNEIERYFDTQQGY